MINSVKNGIWVKNVHLRAISENFTAKLKERRFWYEK
jgi:hypothetical protein